MKKKENDDEYSYYFCRRGSQQSDDGFVFKLQWNESPIIKNKRNKDMTKYDHTDSENLIQLL